MLSREALSRVAKDEHQRVVGARQGEWIFVASSGGDKSKDIASQIQQIGAELTHSLQTLDADLGATCKVCAYFGADVDDPTRAQAERELSRWFVEAAPVYHGVVLPYPLSNGEKLRVDLIALDPSLERKRAPGAWSWPDDMPYSQALRCGDTIFVGAQLPLTDGGKLDHADDLSSQTHLVMRHLRAALNAVDADFEHMTKVNAYFVAEQDLEQWSINVGIRCNYYVKPGPASTGIETRGLSVPGAMISADCIAIVD